MKQLKENKYKSLSQNELNALLEDLDLQQSAPSEDWLILLVAKTGLRCTEALGITPNDFDFTAQALTVNKTRDWGSGFRPSKNPPRTVSLDPEISVCFEVLVDGLPQNSPIFAAETAATVNAILADHCSHAGVPVITMHGLRHTHVILHAM